MTNDRASASAMLGILGCCLVMVTLTVMGAVDVVVMVAHWVRSL